MTPQPPVEIKLTRGKVALVDEADWELIGRYKWHAHRSGKNWYAVAATVGKGKVLMHRLILAATSEHVDHINGNGLDNRRSNLRFCTRSQNLANRRPQPSKSGYRGVEVLRFGKNLYRASIRANGKHLYGPRRSTAAEAAQDRDRLAKEHHGAFAALNFPEAEIGVSK